MKKLTNLFLMALLGLSLVACGTRGKDGKDGVGEKGDTGKPELVNVLSVNNLTAVANGTAAGADLILTIISGGGFPNNSGDAGVKFGLRFNLAGELVGLAHSTIRVSTVGVVGTFGHEMLPPVAGAAARTGVNSLEFTIPAAVADSVAPFNAARSFSLSLAPESGSTNQGSFRLTAYNPANAVPHGTASGTFVMRPHAATI